ncbi:MAG: flagellar motor switch protein FliM [Planctomycetes bacterium]|nr:flagellar motor switch protein FliM [Planctomycetota bacterium]
MADALDQSEIDALLAAATEEEGGGATPVRRAVTPAAIQRDVNPYDFKRPERVSKDQMRTLEAIHEGFARNLGASLSGFLRTIIEVRVATIEQLTYSEFIHSLPNPTNFNLLTAEPLEGQMCLEISPLIIYPIIDRLLGGSSSALFIPQRPMTLIELRLIRRITDRALTCLTEVWSEMVPVKFRISEVESNPHLVQIVAPNEVVVVIGFEVKMEPRTGTISLCFPFNVIEPVMAKLASQGWLAYQRRVATKDVHDAIEESLQPAEVNLTAFLGEATITVEELMNLRPGDILRTTKPSTSDLTLQVEGRNKFLGRLGRYKANRALLVTCPATDDEKL